MRCGVIASHSWSPECGERWMWGIEWNGVCGDIGRRERKIIELITWSMNWARMSFSLDFIFRHGELNWTHTHHTRILSPHNNPLMARLEFIEVGAVWSVWAGRSPLAAFNYFYISYMLNFTIIRLIFEKKSILFTLCAVWKAKIFNFFFLLSLFQLDISTSSLLNFSFLSARFGMCFYFELT